MEMEFLTSEGLEVKTRSRRLFCRVGSVCTCVRDAARVVSITACLASLTINFARSLFGLMLTIDLERLINSQESKSRFTQSALS